MTDVGGVGTGLRVVIDTNLVLSSQPLFCQGNAYPPRVRKGFVFVNFHGSSPITEFCLSNVS